MIYPDLTLYIGSGCPYCRRVTDFLQTHSMKIEIKDVWSDDAAFQELQELAGRTQVPCLKIDDEIMHESDAIIQKLKEIRDQNSAGTLSASK